jgi:hypothetical protein
MLSDKANIVLRAIKGSELTHVEMDTNLNELMNVIDDVTTVVVGAGAGWVTNISALQSLNVPVLPAGRTVGIYVASYDILGDGGEGNWYWQGNSNEAHDGSMVVNPLGNTGSGRWKRVLTDEVRPEYFGAVGDYSWDTQQGTLNTEALQAALCYCNRKGSVLRPMAGRKYLTDTLRLYYDAALNPNWPGRSGRVSILGHGNGHATGALEDPGTAFVHVNGSANPLVELKGLFSIENPSGMGGYFSLMNFNLVGGTSTTDVLRLQGSQGSILLQNYTVKVQNPAGNGIVESTTWETTHINGLIRGGATGDGTWTGVGLDVTTDGTFGQTNMKCYTNVDCYKMGYGIRIGRRGAVQGTFGPLVFIGGQTSLADHHGLWLDGGVISFTSIGQQFEGSRKNAIKISREYEPGLLANDLVRNVKFSQNYITGCGTIEDGSYDSYAIHIQDGDCITIEGMTFNTMGNGLAYNAELVTNMHIIRPLIRTVREYGTLYGTGFCSYGPAPAIQKFECTDAVFNQNPLVQFNDAAIEQFSRYAAGGYLSNAGQTTPTISMGGAWASDSIDNMNFNNPTPLTVTNILGGKTKQVLRLSFSNNLTTIASNGSIYLQDGRDFTPKNSKATLTLQFDGTVWVELARSYGAEPKTIVLETSAVARPHPGTITTEHTFVTVNIPPNLMGLNGILEVDAVFSYSNNANTKTMRYRFGGGAFFSTTATATSSAAFIKRIQNRGVSDSQLGEAASNQAQGGTNANAPYTSAIDTAVTTTVTITGQLAVGTDTMTLERYTVRVIV